ncbi:MAG: hypothetical protein KJ949_03440 [Nanoarchaeota archaeon]|nr:hypothetical protein [Nanoarchaeota archaeon]
MTTRLKKEYWKKIDEITYKLRKEKHIPIIQLIKESPIICHQTKGSTRTALRDITIKLNKIDQKEFPLLPNILVDPTEEALNAAYDILHGHYNSTQSQ